MRDNWPLELEAWTRVLHHYSKRSTRLPLSWQRRALNAAVRPSAESSVEVQHVEANGVPGAWFTPEDADPERLLVYLHGGGYSIGSVRTHAHFVEQLAQRSGMRAFAVDYRLAPEHPFPAQLDDARRVWEYLLEAGIDPERTAIAGESAGGGLTMSTLVALRDAGDPLPAAAAVLSPWVDLTLSGPSIDDNARYDYLSRRVLETYVQRFAPHVDPAHPLVSPMHADLEGLPPLLIQAGEAEALLDDSVVLAERAQRAGVEVELSVYDDMVHGFMLFTGLPDARRAVNEITSFVRRHTE